MCFIYFSSLIRNANAKLVHIDEVVGKPQLVGRSIWMPIGMRNTSQREKLSHVGLLSTCDMSCRMHMQHLFSLRRHNLRQSAVASVAREADEKKGEIITEFL